MLTNKNQERAAWKRNQNHRKINYTESVEENNYIRKLSITAGGCKPIEVFSPPPFAQKGAEQGRMYSDKEIRTWDKSIETERPHQKYG